MTAWRWPVESVIEECKGELGLDHYEVRGWIGWHHHTTMTLLAHHFLVRLRVNRGIEAPALTVAQVRKLLQVVLPKREFNAQEALAELARIQPARSGRSAGSDPTADRAGEISYDLQLEPERVF